MSRGRSVEILIPWTISFVAASVVAGVKRLSIPMEVSIMDGNTALRMIGHLARLWARIIPMHYHAGHPFSKEVNQTKGFEP